MTLALTQAAREAMLGSVGLLARADQGASPSMIYIFTTTRPALGGAAGGSPQVTIVLADPCGSVASGVATLEQADSTGDLIAVDGVPVWGRWVAGDGEILADGDCTGSAGAGPFKVTGSGGGTTLYAGGRAVLGTVSLT